MKHERFYRALATAFVTTISLMLWIAAIATIICGCATHKERSEVHKSDSASVVQEQKQANIITEIASNKTFSFDSIIINETVVSSGDSGCFETAHRNITIRGFKATTITNTTNKVDSSWNKVVATECHKKDSIESKLEVDTGAKAIFPLKIVFSVLVFFIALVLLFRLSKKISYWK
jgi:hypothetical protein